MAIYVISYDVSNENKEGNNQIVSKFITDTYPGDFLKLGESFWVIRSSRRAVDIRDAIKVIASFNNLYIFPLASAGAAWRSPDSALLKEFLNSSK